MANSFEYDPIRGQREQWIAIPGYYSNRMHMHDSLRTNDRDTTSENIIYRQVEMLLQGGNYQVTYNGAVAFMVPAYWLFPGYTYVEPGTQRHRAMTRWSIYLEFMGSQIVKGDYFSISDWTSKYAYQLDSSMRSYVGTGYKSPYYPIPGNYSVPTSSSSDGVKPKEKTEKKEKLDTKLFKVQTIKLNQDG